MIRKLTRDDAQAFKNLRLLALTTDPDVYFATYENECRRDLSSFAAEISAYGEPFGYYGWFTDSGTLAGYLQVARPYSPKQQHTVDLYNLYVHPDYRRKGVGKLLVIFVMQGLKESSAIEQIFLSVMSKNSNALHLYTSVGFTIYGTKLRSLKTKDGYLDEVLMVYDVVGSLL